MSTATSTANVSRRRPTATALWSVLAAAELLASPVRHQRWGLDVLDALPDPMPPLPLGLRCDRSHTTTDGWVPLHREDDGTVIVAVTRRPDRGLIASVEAGLPGSPFRLVALPRR